MWTAARDQARERRGVLSKISRVEVRRGCLKRMARHARFSEEEALQPGRRGGIDHDRTGASGNGAKRDGGYESRDTGHETRDAGNGSINPARSLTNQTRVSCRFSGPLEDPPCLSRLPPSNHGGESLGSLAAIGGRKDKRNAKQRPCGG